MNQQVEGSTTQLAPPTRTLTRVEMHGMFSHASEPKALRGGPRPRLSPYKRDLSSHRGFTKPSIQKLQPLQLLQPLGTEVAVARMAAKCQYGHASTFEPPVKVNFLLHRKLARPALLTLPASTAARKLGATRPVPLPQLAESMPSAAMLA